jgi:hypothetical protein
MQTSAKESENKGRNRFREPESGDTPPLPCFWKDVQRKELREGVCEVCVDKGLRGREVKGIEEVKEAEEGSVSTFMNWSPVEDGGHPQKDDPTRRPGKK